MSSIGVSLKTIHPDEKRKVHSPHEDSSCCFAKCTRCSPNTNIKCYAFKSRNDSIFCVLSAVLLSSLLLAVIAPLIVNNLVDSGIQEEVVIDSTSATNYKSWQTNIGEGNQQIVQGERPQVQELGPYAYKEYYNKFDIEWSDGGDTVEFGAQKYYVFDPERSGPGLTEFDNITLPYQTILGLQFVLEQIPVAATVLVDIYVEMQITSKYNNTIAQLNDLIAKISASSLKPKDKIKYTAQVKLLIAAAGVIYQQIISFVEQSSPVTLLTKLLLCFSPSGISPFWTTQPGPGYFGWLNDPVLLEVQSILDVLYAQTGVQVPWTSAVPGSLANYTTEADRGRRKAKNVMKTGQKDLKQVAKFVRSENQTSTWACISPMNSQNTSEYVEGEEFPACALYQDDWTPEEAEAAGYVQPFATTYANRVAGTNGDQYGPTVTSDLIQIYIPDLYRSAFLQHSEDVDLYGILPLRRYQLQSKDLLNASMNPENEQYYNFAPSGMLNLTKAENAPAWVSFPHFLDGDPSLAAAIGGLNPNRIVHTSFLDIEPQTGLLARAQKSLQLNWFMDDLIFPNSDPALVSEVSSLCVQLELIISNISSIQSNFTNITVDCNLTVVTEALTCLATPSDWTYKGGQGVYFPYAWAIEGNLISQEDAQAIVDSLNDTTAFVNSLQYWCCVVAAGSLAMLLTMSVTAYWQIPKGLDEFDYRERMREVEDEQMKAGGLSAGSSLSPLLSALNSAEEGTGDGEGFRVGAAARGQETKL